MRDQLAPVQHIPWIRAGTGNGYFKKGHTLMTAARVTKSDGSPGENFGVSSLPAGILTELRA